MTEQAQQMSPVVRPLFTVCTIDDKTVISAEIPPMDIEERPCFQTAKGRLTGSYTRVGEADIRMSEYEVYSYAAYRKKQHDDLREESLDPEDFDKVSSGDIWINAARIARFLTPSRTSRCGE